MTGAASRNTFRETQRSPIGDVYGAPCAGKLTTETEIGDAGNLENVKLVDCASDVNG
jgi:hypothetical protein